MINISHKTCSLHTSCKNCWASQLARWSRRSLLTALPSTCHEAGVLPSTESPRPRAAHQPPEMTPVLLLAAGTRGSAHSPPVPLPPARHAGRERQLVGGCSLVFLKCAPFPGSGQTFCRTKWRLGVSPEALRKHGGRPWQAEWEWRRNREEGRPCSCICGLWGPDANWMTSRFLLSCTGGGCW